MSPVHSIQTMSDNELRKAFAQAQDHVRDVHGINFGHEDFEKYLNMHPYFRDAVDEYNKRGLDKPQNLAVPDTDDSEPLKPEAADEKKPLTFTEPDLQQECKLTEKEIEEGQKNLAQDSVPEGMGSEFSEPVGSEVSEPVGQTTSTTIPVELTEKMTTSEVHEEEKTLEEEGIAIQEGTKDLGPGGTGE